ncbi:xaa-Pro aminopeptidase 3 isoform X1 [Vespula pensylvanica]|uniref:xaa-Pro aminopeptidase 3 isoform X1 n=2 Tax=Vespula pensylvanica TaxID=30213 RepID=UPI001CBA4131|nr:xaa-Pro aminopeptidase 3 isoform X1 [Vespula pensylvanica]
MFGGTSREITKSLIVKFGGQNNILNTCWKRFQTNLPRQENVKKILYQKYGQPTFMSHPHLLKDGEVTPGIHRDEFKLRRLKLVENIKLNSDKTDQYKSQFIIIPSSSKVYMSDKIPYVFRQNTDFLYFCGCQEPNTILVITSIGDTVTSILFMNQKDQHSELWEGPKTGVEAAPNLFGVNKALPVTEFERFFFSFINEYKNSIIWYDDNNVLQTNLHTKLNELIRTNNIQKFTNPRNLFHKVRSIKSQSEINLMQKSCDVASMAIKKTMQVSKPGMSEHQLFAIVDYECRMNGAEFLAYPPVVAAGNNANIIHYISNNQIIQHEDMVLMDAGCQYNGYTSDITRTWPANGKFIPEQRILYETVLDIQKELLEKVKEMPTLDQLFHSMCSLLGKRLQEVGLIPKSLSGDKLISAAFSYCPHHVSHYLGMDVHDTAKISANIPLQPGMIITIEPGIYVNPKNPLAPSNFHGLGVRVEDDVLIKENGPLVLSRNCPKEIAEIEAIASENQSCSKST